VTSPVLSCATLSAASNSSGVMSFLPATHDAMPKPSRSSMKWILPLERRA
jgi:hypothetical protein